MKAITEKEKEFYLRMNGLVCPRCQGGDFDVGTAEYDTNMASVEIRCINCDLEWFDLYTLTGIEGKGEEI